LIRPILEALEDRRLLSSTLYVDAISPGADNGSNWTDAYTSLETALGAATSGTTIEVAQGIYTPGTSQVNGMSGTSPTATFQLESGVTIDGGYAGYGASNPDVRDVTAYPTVFSGGNTCYHVVTSSGTDSTAILDGVTITGGNANGTAQGQGSGGGLYDSSGSPSINDCIFSDNSAAGSGAGVYVSGSSGLTLTGCTFSGNTSGYGAGIYVVLASVSLNQCIFNGNSATRFGGGAYLYSTATNLDNCTFVGNSASASGGGVYVYASTPTLSGCVFNDNSSSYGGGLYDNASASSMTHCVFSYNDAGGYGGGVFITSASPTLTACSFVGNTAFLCGGGVYANSLAPTLINCTLSANTALYGGALFNYSSSPVLVNCTLSGNIAAQAGGAITDSSGSTPQLTNCILWGDSAPTGAEINDADFASQATVSYSDVAGGYPGTANINGDPLFISANDLELGRDSPCIDAGSSAALPPGVVTDLAGYPRILGAAVDMGAFESSPVPLPGLIAFTINDGNPQRSMIDTLTVAFNEPVLLGAGAITLSTPGGQAISFTQAVTNDETYVLNFAQDGYVGNSLPDGQYILTVTAAEVTDSFGARLPGGNQSFGFYRLYGDFFGTGEVSLSSLVALSSAFGASVGESNYPWYMDVLGDGEIDLSDLVALSSRFGESLSAPSVSDGPVTVVASQAVAPTPVAATVQQNPVAPRRIRWYVYHPVAANSRRTISPRFSRVT
jgi:parallel beta-helix repeat protein